MSDMVAIYGLFVRGKCRYVGKTYKVDGRINEHAKHKMKGIKHTFRIFKWVPKPESRQAEIDMIQKYRAIGQADLNRYHVRGKTEIMSFKIKSSVWGPAKMASTSKPRGWLSLQVERLLAKLTKSK